MGLPAAEPYQRLLKPCEPVAYRFSADGEVPNNPRLPLVIYRAAIRLDPAFDPASVFETAFAANGWGSSWRNGIYAFRHFHAGAHEVLGIARGEAQVEFGGAAGRRLEVHAGDVAILPAGTGHKRLGQSPDLLVVGAYPDGARIDQDRAGGTAVARALARVVAVPDPASDPVYGANGPLHSLWGLSARTA